MEVARSCLIDACYKLVKPTDRIRLNRSMKVDLYWWVNFMECFNDTTEILDSKPMPQSHFSTDAYLTGCRGNLGQDWFYSTWEADYPHFSGLHINKLEIFTVYLAAKRWAVNLRNKWVVSYVDSSCTLTW